MLEWRQLAKLKSTYTDALQAQINPETGRVHTSYSLVGAQTGRLSSTDPNLQNIPIRTEIGRKSARRSCAEPGTSLLAADYTQIELRLAAHMADVPQLKEAFRARRGHPRAAPPRRCSARSTATPAARAKTINFAILYGISPLGPRRAARRRRTRRRRSSTAISSASPASANYIAQRRSSVVRERGYTETLFGRKT